MRARSRRRSVSSLVSPGPRVPIPPPPATRPPACRDSDSPQPRSRGSMYCSWASSTWALPSRLRACWAKMSRISAVRSMTLTCTTPSSRPQLARGELAVADHGVGAGRGHDVRQLARLARAHVGGRVDLAAPLDEAVEHLGARRLRQPAQLAQRILRAGQAAFGPDPDQHDPLQPQRPVLDLADVLQLGGEPGHPPQRVPVLQVHVPGQIAGRAARQRPCSLSSDIRGCSSPDGATGRAGFHFINAGARSYVPAIESERRWRVRPVKASTGAWLAARRRNPASVGEPGAAQ